MTEPAAKKPRRGCLFYGCLGTFILALIVLLAGYLGFRYAVERFTDTKPLPLPAAQLPADELRRLQDRIANFSRAVDGSESTGPLTLTTAEANGLIQADPDWAFLKDQMYVTFESNQLKAQISLPAEKIGSPRLRGRYLNASGTFGVSLRDGALSVTAESLSAKGRPVPEYIMRHIRAHNFSPSFTNAEVNAALNKLQEVQIRDGKLIIVPKPAR